MVSRAAAFAIAGSAGAATLTAASAPSPLYPDYQRLWGFSTFTLTVIFAVYVFALITALLTVGSLSDRVGRRPVASAALVLLALGMLLFASAGGPGGLMAARIVQGFVGTATATMTAMIMDTAPNRRSGSTVSSAVPATGIVIGAALSGALVEFAPHPRELVFWLLAGTHLVLAGLVWLIPENTSDTTTVRESIARSLLPSIGLPPPTRPTFFALNPSIGATWALAGLYLSLGPSVLREILGVRSHFVVGIVIGVFFAAGVSGAVVSVVTPPRLRQWFGHGALAVGVVVTIAAMVLGALPFYVIGSAIAGFGFGAAFASAVAAVGEVAPAAQRGQVFATMYLVSYLAFSVPALAAGLAVERFGLEPTAVAYGGLDVALILIAVVAGVVVASGRPANVPLAETKSC